MSLFVNAANHVIGHLTNINIKTHKEFTWFDNLCLFHGQDNKGNSL